jgi:hypothetical protein
VIGLQPLKPGETAQPMNYTQMIQNPDALLHKMKEAEAIYKRLSSRINNPPPRIILDKLEKEIMVLKSVRPSEHEIRMHSETRSQLHSQQPV